MALEYAVIHFVAEGRGVPQAQVESREPANGGMAVSGESPPGSGTNRDSEASHFEARLWAWRWLILAAYQETDDFHRLLDTEARPLWKDFLEETVDDPSLLVSHITYEQERLEAALSPYLETMSAGRSTSLANDVERMLAASGLTYDGCPNAAAMQRTLIVYIERLAAVALQLGLTHEGKPASWVVYAIHNEVIGSGLVPRTFYPDRPFSGFGIPLAGSFNLHVKLRTDEGQLEVEGEGTGRDVDGFSVQLGPLSLEREAWPAELNWVETKDLVLKAINGSLDAWNGWLRRESDVYSVDTLNNQNARAERLRDHLLSGLKIRDAAEAKALKRLADAIGLDFPRVAQFR